jgi:hypothetical protein
MTKPKNPQDTTFRNINALKKRVSKLERLTLKNLKDLKELSHFILKKAQ